MNGHAEPAAAAFTTPVSITAIEPENYEVQLERKLTKLKQLFQEFDTPELEVFTSPPVNYRMRSEFTVEQRDGPLHFVMFDKAPAEGEPVAAAEDAGAAAAEQEGHEEGEPERAAEQQPEAQEAGASTSAAAAAAAAAAGAEGQGKGGKKGKKGKKGGKPKGPRRVRVDTFPVATKQVNELMAVVREEADKTPELRQRLFQVNFHTTLAGDAMVTLLYHRKLGPEWQAAAERLRDALAATPTAAAAGVRPHVIGRSRKQKICLDADFVIERLTVGGRTFVQKQVEGSFSQPNGHVCQHMLTWAADVTKPAAVDGAVPALEGAVPALEGAVPALEGAVPALEGAAAAAAAEGAVPAAAAAAAAGGPEDDLLELYCGNGNFTIPLAANFRRVVATEVSKSSVEAARYNMEANGVSNVFLARMASEEFAVTMRERGTRRRLEGLEGWEALRLRTILVDPPRAGLDDFTVELLKEFDRIVYISCNPDTLHANLKAIAPTHRIARFAAFDQFPYTHHLETGVYLVRR
ncbi:hypothetical protein HYH02_007987 [Chlamydomonas schloesseri]|uniref:tRNA (uracil(54)-C(5))-methyltransferase n=1 Tax=Chlamydomonas schloesseri TaxID=2026947 RepID=A0A836B4C8_9CHLO|nr:hypothetical protein HYH02_007987 [Chlamydomonas schloesseri]|eukprot:KAG2447247.1 hypothetical protein HYH02_007987 [Chlamydomonas schloesseri]